MGENNIAVPVICILLVFCIFFSGCTEQESVNTTKSANALRAEEQGVAAENVIDANNMFAFDIYRQIAAEQTEDENIFLSPFSISSVFAPVYEGARGDTADEIGSVFHFPENTGTLREDYREINEKINTGDPDYELSIANALWAENTYPFLESYINITKEYYSANTTTLDFKNHPEETRLTINNWAMEKTKDRIQELVPAGMIDIYTRLVVTNAIFFKGIWAKKFDENNTLEANFTTASGEIVKVPMMQKTAAYDYAETDELQAVKLPYENETGNKLSMIVILPKENELHSVEETLYFKKIREVEDSMGSETVRLSLPKFRFETDYMFSGILKKMGVVTAFSDEDADFSGMDGTGGLYIREVIHKAFVEVNEEGTEAAAATAVVVQTIAPPPGYSLPVYTFRADHPFIFLIEDDETGNILFIGRVSNPLEN
ncbi:proteinase inhibitor I4 serpin [Methanolacinia petrolearia DSM 11571]|uniref:Proteinase inhibitor I4 serpin n=1 Tax=Methanolacinia petrolearia (strain DSM 11571 / OCM 486 / SEBR 4847) TaxID=679926 RepID=E1RK55_METP4|nr:serpin family protein [Methanolacinia petrolearia]ADN35778.1 proteinase inhibitor I4 serpin [Methanolacinia petrolearia DSM 11571]